jgi:hypothetical protein
MEMAEGMMSTDYDVLEIRKPDAAMADVHNKLVEYLRNYYKQKKMDENLARG